MTEHNRQFGYVALIGRPNVGKSTFINKVLGQKLAATSRKPQMTRHQILGVLTEGDRQMAILDLPGIHSRKGHRLNAILNKTALAAIHDVDILAVMVEAEKWTEEDEKVFEAVAESGKKKVLIINKVDLIKEKGDILPLIESLSSKLDFDEVIPVSAGKNTNIESAIETLMGMLPEGEFFFAEDDLTDRSTSFVCSEFIREKVHRLTGQEIPYATAIKIDSFKPEGKCITIHATIWVDRDSQKRIIIGKGGSKIKEIGIDARKELERFLEQKVDLRLWVKVKKDWQNSERALSELDLE